jgi:hypothetical protein
MKQLLIGAIGIQSSLVRILKRALGPTSLLLVMFILCVQPAILAQSETGSSGIEGAVLDTDSNPVVGASVTIQNSDTGYSRTVVSGSDGRYRALAMPVGTYRVAAKGAAGTASLDGVPLTVGTRRSVNLILTAAEAAPNGFSNGADSLEREEAASGASFGTRAVTDLPIRGRNFPEFVKLTPAVLQEGDRLGLIISGQRSINSNVSIDGSDFNDPLQGNQRGGNEGVFFFPQTAVREFQVVRSGLSVEEGRTTAGFVNVVTKSGNNNWHGEALFQNRNRHLTSADAFDRSLDQGQNHFGGSVGGPIKRDEAFFFIGFEQEYLRAPFWVEFTEPPAGVVVPADLQALEGEHRGTNNPTALFARADYFLSAGHSLNLSYNFSNQRAENFNREASVNTAESVNFLRKARSHGVWGTLTSVLSASALNQVRAQVATDDRAEVPNAFAPQIVIAGFGTIGGENSRPRTYNVTLYQVTDNLSKSIGKHELRTGVDFLAADLYQQRISIIQGRYDFKSLSDYLIGKVDRFRQTLPGEGLSEMPALDGVERGLALYVQDKVALHHSISLTAGLRWEGQWNPQPASPNAALPATKFIPDDLRQWQPRLGLAWAPGKSRRTVLRLSAGMFTARTPATLFQRISTENGISTVSVDSKVDKSVLKLVTFPQILTSIPTGVKLAQPSTVGIYPNFRNPRSFQTAATLEHMFGKGIVVSSGYIHSSTWNLQRRLDRNLFAPTIDATGMPIFPSARPDSTIGKFSINESSAHSRYDALILTMIYPVANRVNAQLNYTFARNLDDDSNERNFNKEGTLNPFDLTLERAYSKQDVRHALNIASWMDLPHGFIVSAILLTRSGFPYNPIIGYDTQGDGNDFNDRAIINGHVAGRNSRREPSFFNLDFRVVKAFPIAEGVHVDAVAEVFNATRASNKNFGVDGISNFGTPSSPDPNAGVPLFAPGPGQYGGPRQLQLGVRLMF